MFGSLAIDNVTAKFKARFSPDPEGGGYLFFYGDYGSGVKCSGQQYEDYVREFEQFVAQKIRFMWLWGLLVMVLGAVGMVLAGIYFGQDVLDKKNEAIPVAGGVLIVLPLVFIFRRGWRLYQKPADELVDGFQLTQKRQSTGDIFNRRLKGMSLSMIFMGIMVSALGLFVSLISIDGVNDSPSMPYYFGAIFAGFALTAWWKYKAHKADEELLSRQRVFSPDKAQQAYLELADIALYDSDPDRLKEKILEVPLNEIEADGAPVDEYQYFYTTSQVLEQADMPLFMSMDWKEDVADFHFKIKSSLAYRSVSLDLPALSRYPEDVSVSYEGVFNDVAIALRKADIEICFIDDGSDTYHAFLFERKNREKVQRLVRAIQLPFTFGGP